ncbi:MAG: ribonuclease R [Gammaproteobacteria bacterium]|nr:ribonuclease R [Gammaproteobacteria bacterium]
MTKKKTLRLKDPHADREANKYEKPIVSREFILEYLAKRGAPATHETLCEELQLHAPDDIEALRRRLIAMCRDGQLVCNRRDAYAPLAAVDLIRGRVQGHKDGFGFVIPEDGSSDLFLSARQMRQVFHGDGVVVRVDGLDDRGRREAVIVDVLERRTQRVVGRLFREHGVAFVAPENTRITQEVLVPDEHCAGARHGQYVTVAILQQPTLRTKATGKVIEVLGDHMAPGMEIDVAIRAHNIPHEWPPAVTASVAGLAREVQDGDKGGRVDLRALPLVTIDGEDARDFDDAVYCEPVEGGGWRLLVAIADVAHYVRPGTPLDQEARERGNSVYFPDHVVPMLPEVLSNGLCSLNPDEDRLCMVCDMRISRFGKVREFEFYEAIMHSQARLTYTKVGAMIEQPDGERGALLREEYAPLLPQIDALHAVYKALRRARDRRGAIDFETTETRIIFTEGRKIDEIVPVERNTAHKLIEECMLCANVCAAELLKKAKRPTLYRVHEGPSEEKLANLKMFLAELGLTLGGGDAPTPSDYQALLSSIVDRPDAHIIQTVMLRSLSQAVYSPELKGHFGLGYEHYAHFTSPIRRYPDLLVHRAIKALAHSGGLAARVRAAGAQDVALGRWTTTFPDMLQAGEHCSMTERRADEATRDVMAWLKCEFLRQHVGERFEGVISAVTSFGFFVELTGIYIEGLVHVSSLTSDYYHFDPVKHRMIGERSGVSFRLGDEVEVQVARVELDDRKIDLELVRPPKRKKGELPDTLPLAVRKGERSGKGGKGGRGAKPAGASVSKSASGKASKSGAAQRKSSAATTASAKGGKRPSAAGATAPTKGPRRRKSR